RFVEVAPPPQLALGSTDGRNVAQDLCPGRLATRDLGQAILLAQGVGVALAALLAALTAHPALVPRLQEAAGVAHDVDHARIRPLAQGPRTVAHGRVELEDVE